MVAASPRRGWSPRPKSAAGHSDQRMVASDVLVDDERMAVLRAPTPKILTEAKHWHDSETEHPYAHRPVFLRDVRPGTSHHVHSDAGVHADSDEPHVWWRKGDFSDGSKPPTSMVYSLPCCRDEAEKVRRRTSSNIGVAAELSAPDVSTQPKRSGTGFRLPGFTVAESRAPSLGRAPRRWHSSPVCASGSSGALSSAETSVLNIDLRRQVARHKSNRGDRQGGVELKWRLASADATLEAEDTLAAAQQQRHNRPGSRQAAAAAVAKQRSMPVWFGDTSSASWAEELHVTRNRVASEAVISELSDSGMLSWKGAGGTKVGAMRRPTTPSAIVVRRRSRGSRGMPTAATAQFVPTSESFGNDSGLLTSWGTATWEADAALGINDDLRAGSPLPLVGESTVRLHTPEGWGRPVRNLVNSAIPAGTAAPAASGSALQGPVDSYGRVHSTESPPPALLQGSVQLLELPNFDLPQSIAAANRAERSRQRSVQVQVPAVVMRPSSANSNSNG
jgi:hypothetical protein